MNQKRLVSLIAAIFILGLLGAGAAFLTSSPRQQTLTITGSSTVAPLAMEIAKRFEQAHPDIRVDIQTGGSSRGIADAKQGLADIGMVSRALKSSESDLTGWQVGLDGLSIIVNEANPIQELTRQEILDIYTGRINNWNAVGGKNAPITVVHKAEGRSTLELFLHFFELSNKEIQPDIIIGDNEQGIKMVSGNPDAIGYVSIGVAEYDAQQGIPIKLLPLGGVPASIDAVKSGAFPLSRELNFVTAKAPEGAAKEFLDFALSPEVRDLVEGQYFVPVQ